MAGKDLNTARLVNGAVSAGLANVVGLGTGFGIVLLSTRFYAPEVYGAFVLLQVVVGLLLQVSNFGLSLSVPKFIAASDDPKVRSDIIGTALLFRLAVIGAACILAWLGQSLLARLFGAGLGSNLLLYVPLLLLLNSVRDQLTTVLQGFFLFRHSGLSDLFVSLGNLLLLLVVIRVLKSDMLGLVLARAGGLLIASIFAYFSIPGKKRLVWRMPMARQLIQFGLPLQANDVLHYIFTRLDTFIIAALMGPAQVALYEVARRIPDSLNQVYGPLQSAYFPFLSRLFDRGEKQEAASVINTFARLVAFTCFFGAAVALAFGGDIFGLLFGNKYAASVPVFKVLMVGLGVSLVSNVLGTSLVAVGEPDKPAKINLAHVTVSLVGNILLIPVLGMMGAAIVTLLGPIVTNVLDLILLRRNLDVRPQGYLKPMLILAVWGGCVLLLKPAPLGIKAALVALYLVPCVLFSVITRKDLALALDSSGLTRWRSLRWLKSVGSET